MAVSSGPDIVEDGLALCLDAANSKSYPGTGTTWIDISGNNRNATKAGSQSPTYPQHANSKYFTFTGGVTSDNYSRFDVSNIPSFSSLSAFVWYRTTDTTSSKTAIRMNNSDFELSINGSSQLFIAAGTNWNDINANTGSQNNATNGNWHQIGLTFNGINLIGYFDGVQVTSNTRATATTTAAGTLRIGTRDDAAAQHFVGDISSVYIYSKVLSAAEVQQNYNAARGRFGL